MPRGVHIARQRNRRVLDFVGYQTISDARDLLAGDCQAHAQPESRAGRYRGGSGRTGWSSGFVRRDRLRDGAYRNTGRHRMLPFDQRSSGHASTTATPPTPAFWP